MIKEGDVVICIDDDSEDLDFGASGFVMRGRRDLKVGKEYEVEDIDLRHVKSSDNEEMQLAWTRLKLKGVKNLVWLKNFKQKINK